MNLDNFKLCYPRAIADSEICVAVIEKLQRRGVNRNALNRIYNALHCPCWAVLATDNTVISTHDKEPTYICDPYILVEVEACTCEDNIVTIHAKNLGPMDVFIGIDAVNYALATFGPLLLFTDG